MSVFFDFSLFCKGNEFFGFKDFLLKILVVRELSLSLLF